MEHLVRKLLAFAVIVALLVTTNLAVVRAAPGASPNDTARFLAGLPPAANSPLAPSAGTPGWQFHVAKMGAAWAAFERRQVTRIRVWAAAKLINPQPAMFYMFGGPDFVHADAFFPHATTYVLSGLEPVGPRPLVSELPGPVLAGSMASLHQSLSHFLEFGYFITSQMGTQFKVGKFNGTLPVLYVFLARSGKTIVYKIMVNTNKDDFLETHPICNLESNVRDSAARRNWFQKIPFKLITEIEFCFQVNNGWII